jgi:sugar phosphate isomerase/epimerase
LGVVLDPCNLLNADTFGNQEEVMKTAFRLLGQRVVSTHAKDMRREANGDVSGTAAGLGELHYPLFWELQERYKPHGFVTLEDVNEAQLVSVSRFVREGRAAARSGQGR